MNFLDKNGLNHLWTKIKASFGTAIVESSQNPNIPFVISSDMLLVAVTPFLYVFWRFLIFKRFIFD